MSSQEPSDASNEESAPLVYETIYEATDVVHWRLLKEVLLEQDFDVRALGGLTGAQIGTGQQTASHRIQVPQDEAEAAKAAVEAYLAQAPDDPALEELAIIAGHEHRALAPHILNMGALEIRSISPLSTGMIFGIFSFMGTLTWLGLRIFLQIPLQGASFLGLVASVPLGIVAGLFSAWLYNTAAKWVGGIKLMTFDASMLLSQDYQAQDCFYQDSEGQVHGPLTRQALKSQWDEGKLPHDTIVQRGEEVQLAGSITALHKSE